MFVFLFLFLVCGLLFSTIASPICGFLVQYQWILLIALTIGLAGWSVKFGRYHNSAVAGIGFFAVKSQLWFVILETVLGLADIVLDESDPFSALLTTAILGGIMGLYVSFNRKMVDASLKEADVHPFYPWIVGALGWGAILALSLFG